MSKAKEALVKARALIADSRHWTKGTMRKLLQRQVPESYDTPLDYSYCALGAVDKATEDVLYTDRIPIIREAHKCLGLALPVNETKCSYGYYEGVIVNYNDAPSRKHEEVLALFDKAIATCDDEPKPHYIGVSF